MLEKNGLILVKMILVFFFLNNPINIISKDWFYLIFDHVKLSS